MGQESVHASWLSLSISTISSSRGDPLIFAERARGLFSEAAELLSAVSVFTESEVSSVLSASRLHSLSGVSLSLRAASGAIAKSNSSKTQYPASPLRVPHPANDPCCVGVDIPHKSDLPLFFVIVLLVDTDGVYPECASFRGYCKLRNIE